MNISEIMANQQKIDLLDYRKSVAKLERAKQKCEDLKTDYIARYRVYDSGGKVTDIWGTGGDCVVHSAVMDLVSGKIGYYVSHNGNHQFYREFEQLKPTENL